MKCQIKRDENGKVIEVLDLNGKPSVLYNKLRNYSNSTEQSAFLYAISQSNEFRKNYFVDSSMEVVKYLEDNNLDYSLDEFKTYIEAVERIINGNIGSNDFEILKANDLENYLNVIGSSGVKLKPQELFDVRNKFKKDSPFRKVLDFLVSTKNLDTNLSIPKKLYSDIEKAKSWENSVKVSSLLEFSNNRDRGTDDKSVEKNRLTKNTINLGFPKSMAVESTINKGSEKTIQTKEEDIISIEQARKILRNIFGDDVKMSTAIDQVLDNIKEENLPAGMFLNDTIYLNENGLSSGTVYHEAFHRVFRTLLTTEQRNALYSEAYDVFGYDTEKMDAAINDLKKDYEGSNFDIDNLSRQELEHLVLEEDMADKFEASKKGKVPSNNILKALYELLLDLIQNITGKRSKMESLFRKINNRGFRQNYKISPESKLKTTFPMFKTLKTGEVKNHLGIKVETFANEEQTDQIINLVSARLYDKVYNPLGEDRPNQDFNEITIKDFVREEIASMGLIEESKNINYEADTKLYKQLSKKKKGLEKLITKTNNEAKRAKYQEQITEIVAQLSELKVDTFEKNKGFVAQEREFFLPDLSIVHKDGTTNEDLIVDAVYDKFRSVGIYINKEEQEHVNNKKENAIAREIEDKSSEERDPISLMDKDLRAFLSFISYKADDPTRPGTKVIKTVDGHATYFGILRYVHTEDLYTVQDMLSKISTYAIGNEQATAVLEALLKRYQKDPNDNILKQLRKTLNIAKIETKTILVDNVTGSILIRKSAAEDETNAQINEWSKNWYSLSLDKTYNKKLNPDYESAIGNLRSLLTFFQGAEGTVKPLIQEIRQDPIKVAKEIFNGNQNFRSFKDITGIDVSVQFIAWSLVNATKTSTDLPSSKTYNNILKSIYQEGVDDKVLIGSKFLNQLMKKFEVSNLSLESPYERQDVKASKQTNAYRIINENENESTYDISYRARKMAELNTKLDERVISTSFKDAANNTIFGFGKKSYQVNMNLWLSDPDYRAKLIEENPYLKNLPYFKNNKVFWDLGRIQSFQSGETRQVNLDEYDSYGKFVGYRKPADRVGSKDGVTSKNTTIQTLALNNLAMFGFGRKEHTVNGETIVTVPYYSKTYETKNNDKAVMLPLGRAGNPRAYLSTTGGFSQTAIDDTYSIFETEWSMIDKVEKEIEQGLEDLKDYLKNDKSKALKDILKQREQFYNLMSNTIFNSENRKRAYNELIVKDGYISTEITKIDIEKKCLEYLSEEDRKEYNDQIADFDNQIEKLTKIKPALFNKFHLQFKNGEIVGVGRGFELWQFKNYLGNNPVISKKLEIRRRLAMLDIKEKFYDNPLTQEEVLFRNTHKATAKKFTAIEKAQIKQDLKRGLESERDAYIKFLVDRELFKYETNLETGEVELIPISNIELPFSYDEKSKTKNPLYNNFEHFINDYFINHFINVSTYNTIVDRDHRVRKDSVDSVKRNGGSVAHGDDLGSGEFKAGFFKDPIALDKSGDETEIADGQAYMSFDRYKFMNDRIGRMDPKVEAIYDKVELGIPITDWSEIEALNRTNTTFNPVKGVFFNGEHYHKLSYTILTKSLTSFVPDSKKEEQANLIFSIQKINDKLKKLKSKVSDKNEVEKLREDKKELMKRYNLLWQAIPGREYLHNIRVSMEASGVDEMLPESASKLATPIVKGDVNGEFDMSYGINSFQNKNWKLQVETPSGKTKITYFSQVLHLIDNEQLDDYEVEFNGENKTIKEIRREYRETLADRVFYSIEEAFKEIGETDGYGNLVNVDKEKLTKMLYDNLISSASSGNILNYVRDSSLNFNLPATRAKFEQLFITHFNSYLQPKVPGRKVYLMSDYGYQLVIDRTTGKIVSAKDSLEKVYDENGNLKPEYKLRDLQWSQGMSTNFSTGDGTSYDFDVNNDVPKLVSLFGEDLGTNEKVKSFLKFSDEFTKFAGKKQFESDQELIDLLESLSSDNLVTIINELIDSIGGPKVLSHLSGQTIQDNDKVDYKAKPLKQRTLAEVVMPHFSKELFSKYQNQELIPGTPEYNEVMTMFGARIPTQDKHSMVAFKIVDFLPPELGDVGIFPKEIINLSGADFDIDSLYMIRKEFYIEDKDIRIYGKPELTTYIKKLKTVVNKIYDKNFKTSSKDFDYDAAIEFLKREIDSELELTEEELIDAAYSYFEYRLYLSKYNAQYKRELKLNLKNNNALNSLYKEMSDLNKLINANKSQLDILYSTVKGYSKTQIKEIKDVFKKIKPLEEQQKRFYTKAKELKAEIKDLKRDITNKTIKSYAKIEDLNDYYKQRQESSRKFDGNLKSMHNSLVDNNLMLYLNGGIYEISETNASMTVLHGERGNSQNAGLSNIMRFLSGDNSSRFTYNSPIGQLMAKFYNREGLVLVGPAAVSNITKATIARLFTNEKQTKTNLNIGNNSFDLMNYNTEDIIFDVERDDNGNITNVDLVVDTEDGRIVYKAKDVRVMDEISSVLSAMTDNAKHTDAAHLSFNLDNLGTYLYMISGGMGLGTVTLMAKQPYIHEQMKLKDRKNRVIDPKEINYFEKQNEITFKDAAEEITSTIMSFDESVGFFNKLINEKYGTEYEETSFFIAVERMLGDAMFGEANYEDPLVNYIPSDLLLETENLKTQISQFDNFIEDFENQNINIPEMSVINTIDELSQRGFALNTAAFDALLGGKEINSNYTVSNFGSITPELLVEEIQNNQRASNVAVMDKNTILNVVNEFISLDYGDAYNKLSQIYKNKYIANRDSLKRKLSFTESRMYNEAGKRYEADNKIAKNKLLSYYNQKKIKDVLKNKIKPEGEYTGKKYYQLINNLAKTVTLNSLNRNIKDINTIVTSLKKVDFNTVFANAVNSVPPKDSDLNLLSNDLLPVKFKESVEIIKDLKERYNFQNGDAKSLMEIVKSGKPEDRKKAATVILFQASLDGLWKEMSRGGSMFTSVSSLIRLHQGLGATFEDIDDVSNALDNLGIVSTKSGEVFVDEKENSPFSVTPLIEASPDYKQLVKSFNAINDAASKIMVSRHPLLMNIRASLTNNFGEQLTYNRQRKYVKNVLMKFINYKLYKSTYENAGKEFNYGPELIYSSADNIGTRLDQTIQKAKEYGVDLSDNLFIKQLRKNKQRNSFIPFINENGQEDYLNLPMNLLVTNTRTNRDPSFANRITNAFSDLYGSDLIDENGNYFVREFVNDLLGYSLVADGMTFGQGSFIQMASPEAFYELSAMYDKFMNSTPEDAVKMLGFNNMNDLIEEFSYLLATDSKFPNSQNQTKYIKNKNAVSSELAPYLNVKLNNGLGHRQISSAGDLLDPNTGEFLISVNPDLQIGNKFNVQNYKENSLKNDRNVVLNKIKNNNLVIPTDVLPLILLSDDLKSIYSINDLKSTMSEESYSNLVNLLIDKYQTLEFAEEALIKQLPTALNENYKKVGLPKEKIAESHVNKINSFFRDGIVSIDGLQDNVPIYSFPFSVSFEGTYKQYNEDGTIEDIKATATYIRTGFDEVTGVAKYTKKRNLSTLNLNYTTDINKTGTYFGNIYSDFEFSSAVILKNEIANIEYNIKKAKERGKLYTEAMQKQDEAILEKKRKEFENYKVLKNLSQTSGPAFNQQIVMSENNNLRGVLDSVENIFINSRFDGKANTNFVAIPNNKLDELKYNNLEDRDSKLMFTEPKDDDMPQYHTEVFEHDGVLYKKESFKLNSVKELLETLYLKDPSANPKTALLSMMFDEKSEFEKDLVRKIELDKVYNKPLVFTAITKVDNETKSNAEKFNEEFIFLDNGSGLASKISEISASNKKSVNLEITDIETPTYGFDKINPEDINKMVKVSNASAIIYFGDKPTEKLDGVTYLDGNSNYGVLNDKLKALDSGRLVMMFNKNSNIANAKHIIDSLTLDNNIPKGMYPTTRAFVDLVKKDPNASVSLKSFLETGKVMGSVTINSEIVQFLNSKKHLLEADRKYYEAYNFKNKLQSNVNSFIRGVELDTSISEMTTAEIINRAKNGAPIMLVNNVVDTKNGYKTSTNSKSLVSFYNDLNNTGAIDSFSNDNFLLLDGNINMEVNAKRLKNFLIKNKGSEVLLLNSIALPELHNENPDYALKEYKNEKDALKKLDPFVYEFFNEVKNVAISNGKKNEEKLKDSLRENNIIC